MEKLVIPSTSHWKAVYTLIAICQSALRTQPKRNQSLGDGALLGVVTVVPTHHLSSYSSCNQASRERTSGIPVQTLV